VTFPCRDPAGARVRVLGHASAAVTMDLYGHLVDGNLWQAAGVVGASRAHLSCRAACSAGR
jgi:hypothetical protein